MKDEFITAYITGSALKTGAIQIAQGNISGKRFKLKDDWRDILPSYWHKTPESALLAAEEMRARRIKALQIDLASLVFKIGE